MRIKNYLALSFALAVLVTGGVFLLTEENPPVGSKPVEVQEKLDNKLKGKSAKERANIKGQAIASAVSKGKVTRSEYEIEIVDIEPIEGGVQVFARAWKNDKQIGFGKDGTVDIERFRIFNPPVLVPDPQGNIIRKGSVDEITGEKSPDRKLREDPQEALIQVIEHNLSVMKNIHGDEAIVEGKRGNTTSTFYPAAGANQPVDGQVLVSLANPGVSWASINTSQSGSAIGVVSAIDGENNITTGYYGANSSGNWRYRVVSFYLFDTSGIPDTDGVDSATLSLYGIGSDSPNTLTINIVEGTPAANDNLTGSDFYAQGDVKFSTGITNSSWDTAGFNDFALNSSGLSNITKTGISKFSQRTEEDIDDSEPTWVNNVRTGVDNYYADQTGTTQDPKLVVEHSAAAAGDFSKYGDTFIFD